MYLWFKALHLIAMVTWFAGLFYMFRLYVYLSENKQDSSRVEILNLMAYRLYRYITTPGMFATWLFGLLVLSQAPHLLQAPWFGIKLSLLVGLSCYHYYVGYVGKRYQQGDIYLSSKQCRIWNEVPTIFLLAIVFLAVLKPF